MDTTLLRIANWLVGNDGDEAALECTLLGPRLQFDTDSVIAWCGADVIATLDGIAFPAWRPVPVARGSVLDLGALQRGARGYLAFAGGIDVAEVLGSRSVDLNAGLGPCEGRGRSHRRPGSMQDRCACCVCYAAATTTHSMPARATR
jgi:antagonist of KipI